MTFRPRPAVLVLPLALVIASTGCAGSGAKKGAAPRPSEPVASIASSAPQSSFDTIDPEAFRATMKRGAEAEKADLDRAATLYAETLERTDLTVEQRATVHHRMARVRLAQGRIPEARTFAQQALAARPRWEDAEKLLKRIEERAAAGPAAAEDPTAAGGVDKQKAARKKDGAEASPRKEKSAAKAETKTDRRKGVKPPDASAVAAAKKRSDDVAAQLRQLETERDLLRSRILELESQLAGLQAEAATKRAAGVASPATK